MLKVRVQLARCFSVKYISSNKALSDSKNIFPVNGLKLFQCSMLDQSMSKPAQGHKSNLYEMKDMKEIHLVQVCSNSAHAEKSPTAASMVGGPWAFWGNQRVKKRFKIYVNFCGF